MVVRVKLVGVAVGTLVDVLVNVEVTVCVGVIVIEAVAVTAIEPEVNTGLGVLVEISNRNAATWLGPVTTDHTNTTARVVDHSVLLRIRRITFDSPDVHVPFQAEGLRSSVIKNANQPTKESDARSPTHFLESSLPVLHLRFKACSGQINKPKQARLL